MIFLDTSAIYALADVADPRHRQAREWFVQILEAKETILTHNYVLVESIALIQHRLGVSPALKLAEGSSAFEIEWVGRALHEAAVRQLSRNPNRRVSLVDQVSFLVMRRRGAQVALAFDADFEEQGFRLYSG